MRKILQIAAALGLASCLLVPSVSDAKPKAPKECKLNSQEFVLFEMDISQKIISLQDDLISSNINNVQIQSGLKALINANNNLYNDVGRRASQSDKFVYTPEKLNALKDAANDYYTIVYYLLRNRTNHLLDAYRIVQATQTAADEFKEQCDNNKKRGKNWHQKWDNIYTSNVYGEPIVRPVVVAPSAQPTYAPVPAAVAPVAQPTYAPVPAAVAPVAQPTYAPALAGQYPNGWNQRPAPDRRPRRAMNRSSFNDLSDSVKKAFMDSDKKVTIQSAISSGNYFSCDQIATLAKHFTFDDVKIEAVSIMADASADGCTTNQVAAILKQFNMDSSKVKVAVKLYEIVSDRNNWFKIYDSFQFSSSRKEVEDQIRNK